MVTIYFDVETRQFSVMDKIKSAGKAVGAHVSGNKRAYITGGTAALTGAAGAYIARKKAMDKARAEGASEADVKKAGRKAALKGGLVGAGVGAAAGELGQLGVKSAKEMKRYQRMTSTKDNGFIKNLGKSIKGASHDMYIKPFKKSK